MSREAVISSGRPGIGETPIFAEGSIRGMTGYGMWVLKGSAALAEVISGRRPLPYRAAGELSAKVRAGEQAPSHPDPCTLDLLATPRRRRVRQCLLQSGRAVGYLGPNTDSATHRPCYNDPRHPTASVANHHENKD